MCNWEKFKMSSVKSKPFSMKIIKIRCRICDLEFVQQNYKLHIKWAHPEADQNDSIPHQQSSLLKFCSSNVIEACAVCVSSETGTVTDNVGSRNPDHSISQSESDSEKTHENLIMGDHARQI